MKNILNMKTLKIFITFIGLLFTQFGCTQPPTNRPILINKEFDKKLGQLLAFSVPLMGVSELNNTKDNIHIFDTRELAEYNVSHIKGAQYLGYDHFDPKLLADTPKDETIVLYCSVGYRSEKIGERLQKMGYKKVYNLYGSIFEWINQGYPVVNKEDKIVSAVHTYNKNWSKWVNNPDITKIW